MFWFSKEFLSQLFWGWSLAIFELVVKRNGLLIVLQVIQPNRNGGGLGATLQAWISNS
jgi:hypothetical protein